MGEDCLGPLDVFVWDAMLVGAAVLFGVLGSSIIHLSKQLMEKARNKRQEEFASLILSIAMVVVGFHGLFVVMLIVKIFVDSVKALGML